MDMGHPLLLSKLLLKHSKYFDYEPELFPGGKYVLYLNNIDKPITLKIFVSGKINITGAKKMKHIDLAFRKMMTFLTDFYHTSTNCTTCYSSQPQIDNDIFKRVEI